MWQICADINEEYNTAYNASEQGFSMLALFYTPLTVLKVIRKTLTCQQVSQSPEAGLPLTKVKYAQK